jgi:hypothetical protein
MTAVDSWLHDVLVLTDTGSSIHPLPEVDLIKKKGGRK